MRSAPWWIPAIALSLVAATGPSRAQVAEGSTGGPAAAAAGRIIPSKDARSFDPPGSVETVSRGIAPGPLPEAFEHSLLSGWYKTSSGATEGFAVLPTGKIEAPIVDPRDTLHYTAPAGVDNAGTIVGTYENTTPVGEKGPVDTYHGFLRMPSGKFTTYDFGKILSTGLDGINNNGDITGDFGSTAVVTQGFILPKGGKPTAFGVPGLATYPQALNGSDAVVGIYVDSHRHDHAFKWEPSSGLTAFDYPGARATVAGGINDSGTINGYFEDEAGHTHGFYGSLGHFRQYDLSGAVATLPSGIDDFGAVTGSYEAGDGKLHGFVAQLCAVDQSNNVNVIQGAITLDHKTGEYRQTVIVTNAGSAAMAGPVYLLFEGLPPGLRAANGTGLSTCVAPQVPYAALVPAGSVLDAGQAVSVRVRFVGTPKATISYTPTVAAGPRI